ncbi:DinB family protein [Phytohabitans sp. LJ34]|uniref:DinB family protein n=1 Tax=Phytohabitans sp. LJ34 TaxID=3452217 RepID=UPI003F8B7C57
MTDRKPPGISADEKTTLVGFLNYLRDAITAKATGVPEPQVRTPGVPSGTSLLGLIKHLTSVERYYFQGADVRNWAATFKPTRKDTVDSVLAGYRQAVAEANAVIESCDDLAQPVPRSVNAKSAPSMRWLLTHMIEETARHAGHADILREQIDGATGR